MADKKGTRTEDKKAHKYTKSEAKSHKALGHGKEKEKSHAHDNNGYFCEVCEIEAHETDKD